MWEPSSWNPQGSISLRKIFAFATALLVACFVYIIASAPSVFAADATFNNQALTYDQRQHSGPFTATGTTPPGLAKDVTYYFAPDPSNTGKGTVVYFPRGVNPQDTTTAQVAEATLNESGNITAISTNSSQDISVSKSEESNNSGESSCDIEGIGWMACPASKAIAGGVDFLFGIMTYFLRFEPLSTAGSSNSIYAMWNVVRSIANVAFVVAFLIIIYSEMTSSLFSSYTVKKLLPRIVVAAILVNISFMLCAVFVDLSNILGAAVYDLFHNLKGVLNIEFDAPLWSDVVANGLAGTGIVVGGVSLFAATAGGAGALFWLIIASLMPVIFAALVAVAILAARQALITLLVIIAPLAFVAYLLPNTEDWFKRWRKLFTVLLIMYPAFSLIFGASQIAGLIIMQNSKDFIGIIFGLTVQAIPLFITPFLIKLSSGLLGTIAGLANDKSKGVFDRTKNWANSRKDASKARAMRNGLTQGRRGNMFRPTTYGARAAMSKANREARTKALMGQAQGLYDNNTRAGRLTALEANRASTEGDIAKKRNDERYQALLAGERLAENDRRVTTGPQWVQNSANGLLERSNDRAEARRQALGSDLRHRIHEAHESEVNAGILHDQLHNEGEQHARDKIAAASGQNSYLGRINAAQVDSIRTKGLAENSKGIVEAAGNLALKQAIEGNASRVQQVVLTQQFTKDAEQYDAIVQKAAERAYDDRARVDASTQNLRLRAVEQTDQAKLAEQQWNTIIENIKAEGYTSTSVSAGNSVIADNIRALHTNTELESRAEQNAKVEQTKNLTDMLLKDTMARRAAGGIRGEAGAESVLASAIASYRKEYGDRINEKTQLAKHFNLSSEERQLLAEGVADVTSTRPDGTSYTFRVDDEFVRESSIETQLKAGSFGQIEKIIALSGKGLANEEYRTTIADAIVANGLPGKALYFGSKTIDDVAQGRINGDEGLNNAALYHIRAGKLKDAVVATQSGAALERMFKLAENPSAAPEWTRLSSAEQQIFLERAEGLRQSAKRILTDPDLKELLAQADDDAINVLKKYRAQ